ncbi:MAG: hypothetical protein ACP5T7_04100 [bacterium]
MPDELISNLFLTFVSIIIIWFVGAFIMFILFKNELSLSEFIGFSYISGAGITGALLYISSIIFNRFCSWFIYAFLFIAGIISFILWVNSRHIHIWKTIKQSKQLRYYEYLLILFALFIIVVVILEGIAGAPNWDGLLTYGFIAKSLFLSNRIDMKFFTDVIRYGHVHLDYPLLLPLLEYWLYHFIGSDNYQIIQFISIGYYIALVCIFYGSMRQRTARSIALLSLLILMYNPIIISNTVGGDADIIVATYFTGILVIFSKLFTYPSIKTAFMLGMLTGFLANTKNEGFAFFLMFSVLLMFIPGVTKKIWLYYFIPSALLGLPWFITKWVYDIRSDLFINVFQQIPLFKERLPIVLNYYYHFFTGTFPIVKGTGFLWLIVILSFNAMLIKKSIRHSYGILWLPFILQFLIYTAVYFITPHTIKWQLELSIFRTMTQFAPPLLWLSVISLWGKYDNGMKPMDSGKNYLEDN